MALLTFEMEGGSRSILYKNLTLKFDFYTY